jgi:hypothetical protein
LGLEFLQGLLGPQQELEFLWRLLEPQQELEVELN